MTIRDLTEQFLHSSFRTLKDDSKNDQNTHLKKYPWANFCMNFQFNRDKPDIKFEKNCIFRAEDIYKKCVQKTYKRYAVR